MLCTEENQVDMFVDELKLCIQKAVNHYHASFLKSERAKINDKVKQFVKDQRFYDKTRLGVHSYDKNELRWYFERDAHRVAHYKTHEMFKSLCRHYHIDIPK